MTIIEVVVVQADRLLEDFVKDWECKLEVPPRLLEVLQLGIDRISLSATWDSCPILGDQRNKVRMC